MFHTRNLVIFLCLFIVSLGGFMLRSTFISPVEAAYAESGFRAAEPESLGAVASTTQGLQVIETANTSLPAADLNPVVNPLAGPASGHFPVPWSIADLDATTSMSGRYWYATITIKVVDMVGNPVTQANVLGRWSDGATASCTTDAAGQCRLTSLEADTAQVSSLTFTVDTLTHLESSLYTYQPARNIDPDHDSNGTSITANRS